jgi:hypothetical protein
VLFARVAGTSSNQCFVREDISKQKEKMVEEATGEEKWKRVRAGGISLAEKQDSSRFSFVPFYCLIVTGTAEYTLHGFSYCSCNDLTAATIVDNDSIY